MKCVLFCLSGTKNVWQNIFLFCHIFVQCVAKKANKHLKIEVPCKRNFKKNVQVPFPLSYTLMA